MKYPYLWMTLFLLSALLLNSCGASTAGPQAWIDTPLDNTIVPLAPLAIMAHASGSSGVASIEFYADDQLLTAVGAGGGRLGWAEYEGWTPPAPGTYLVGARGIDNNGTAGALATSLITVSGAYTLPVPLPGPETLPLPLPGPETLPPPAPETIAPLIVTEMPETLPAATEPIVVAKLNANCRKGPGTAFENYGNLLQGQEALIQGRLADNSWLLVALPNRSSYCWIAASVVAILGDLDTIQVAAAAAPPILQTEPPPAIVQTEPPQPLDTTTPTISYRGIDPWEMYVSGCGGFNQKIRLTIEASDEGGISAVESTWSIGSESGYVILNYVGASRYQGWFGPVNTKGTLYIFGSVVDNAGNWMPFEQTVNVKSCIE